MQHSVGNTNTTHTFMVDELGFKRGLCSPCTFYHEERNLRAVIHGDDFTILGFTSELDWFRNAITTKWQIKVKGRIGPAPDDLKLMHVLNRLVEWKPMVYITKHIRDTLSS